MELVKDILAGDTHVDFSDVLPELNRLAKTMTEIRGIRGMGKKYWTEIIVTCAVYLARMDEVSPQDVRDFLGLSPAFAKHRSNHESICSVAGE